MGGYNKVVPNGCCVYAVMCSVCSHIVGSVLWFWYECFIAECLVFYKSNIGINQKGGFCIAKVWFLFFECCVVAICLECYHNPFAAKWQSVSNVLAIRQQHFGKPLAAVGVRFIVPAYTKTPTKWGTEMCVR